MKTSQSISQSIRRGLSRKVLCLSLLSAASLGAMTSAYGYDGVETYTAGRHFFKRVVTDTIVHTTRNPNWSQIPFAITSVTLQPGQRALVNVGYSAETRCVSQNAAPEWCELRIMVGGVEANPAASGTATPFAFDSTGNGNETLGSWEGHAVHRHICLYNNTTAVKVYPVSVQWQVTNFGVNPVEFWVDDTALTVEMAQGCTLNNQVPGDPEELQQNR